MRRDQLKQQTTVLLAIVICSGSGSGASPGDGCRVETPANDRQTKHAVGGTKFKWVFFLKNIILGGEG